MEEKRILCVDDDINMLNTLEDVLISSGYSVSLAKSGRQAVEYIKKGIEFQLVLIDVDMPEMDGYETLKEIRNLDNAKDLPIIFLTAADESDSEDKGFEDSATDYITKPFVKSVFLARIKNRISANNKENLDKGH